MKTDSYFLGMLAFVLLSFISAAAQFESQDAQTTADFRGVHAVNSSVACVSGTQGTVLRTEDGGHALGEVCDSARRGQTRPPRHLAQADQGPRFPTRRRVTPPILNPRTPSRIKISTAPRSDH